MLPFLSRIYRNTLPILMLVLLCSSATTAMAEAPIRDRALKHFSALPKVQERYAAQAQAAEHDNNAALVHLGKTLFNERLMSINAEMTCASCHRLVNGAGYFKRPALDTAASGEQASLNTPAVLNLALAEYYGWYGVSKSLEGFLSEHLLSSAAMAMPSREAIEKRLHTNPSYDVAFTVAFSKNVKESAAGPQVSFERTVQALSAYLRTVGSEDAFDEYLSGNDGALNQRQLQGLDLFMSQGCVRCHQGPLLGANQLVQSASWTIVTADEATQSSEATTIKVPSLRNVAVTAPYWHDGSINDLNDAIQHEGALAAETSLNKEQLRAIQSFLQALTDRKQL